MDDASAAVGQAGCQFAERAALPFERALGGDDRGDSDGDSGEIEAVSIGRAGGLVSDTLGRSGARSALGAESAVGVGVIGIGEVPAGAQDQERLGGLVGKGTTEYVKDRGHGRLPERPVGRAEAAVRTKLPDPLEWPAVGRVSGRQASRTLDA
ncbi:MAG: hypothetical protein ACK4WH_13320 [Phycisphaerales bacterium]